MMFRATSQRIVRASIPKTAQQSLPRSISTTTTTTRPTIPRTNYENHRSLLSRNGLQSRNLSFSQRMRFGFREASKGIWRKNPILLPLAIVSTVGAGLLFAYTTYIELTQVAPQYHNFPPPVAQTLRTAIYYTEVDLNPPKALKAYKEALHIGLEMGMHPFSDEVIGIKLQVAMMLEKAGLVKPATDVLERTKAEALKWVDEGRKKKELESKEVPTGSQDQKKTEEGKVVIDDPEILETQERLKELEEYEARQRAKTLKKAVGIQMKLAELYASDYIQDEKKAEAAQVASVELALKELHRRQSLGIPIGGASQDYDSDAWLNLTEMATALAELATTYINQEKFELAMPLYLRALDLLRMDEGNSPTCKQVTLLNSVATAMAGHVQKPTRQTQSQQQQQQPVPREQTISAAKQWAQKSIDVAARIQPPVRDEDCDLSCVAATYNLGELSELQGDHKGAIKLYQETKSLASGLGFEEGVAMAESGMKRATKVAKK